MEDIELLKNKCDLLTEDLECIHLYLDNMGAPRKDNNGVDFSIVGRIKYLLWCEMSCCSRVKEAIIEAVIDPYKHCKKRTIEEAISEFNEYCKTDCETVCSDI